MTYTQRYIRGSGRASRTGFWWTFLALVIVGFFLNVFAQSGPLQVQDPDKLQQELLIRNLTETSRTGTLAGGAAGMAALRQQQEQNALFRANRSPPNVMPILFLASIVVAWSVTTRRFHDTGRSGWNNLWWFLPVIGQFILIIFCIFPSEKKENRYGPNPTLIKTATPPRP
jgi:uncharacterized membrane protein YhaH (DUF805 family)